MQGARFKIKKKHCVEADFWHLRPHTCCKGGGGIMFPKNVFKKSIWFIYLIRTIGWLMYCKQ